MGVGFRKFLSASIIVAQSLYPFTIFKNRIEANISMAAPQTVSLDKVAQDAVDVLHRLIIDHDSKAANEFITIYISRAGSIQKPNKPFLDAMRDAIRKDADIHAVAVAFAKPAKTFDVRLFCEKVIAIAKDLSNVQNRDDMDKLKAKYSTGNDQAILERLHVASLTPSRVQPIARPGETMRTAMDKIRADIDVIRVQLDFLRDAAERDPLIKDILGSYIQRTSKQLAGYESEIFGSKKPMLSPVRREEIRKQLEGLYASMITTDLVYKAQDTVEQFLYAFQTGSPEQFKNAAKNLNEFYKENAEKRELLRVYDRLIERRIGELDPQMYDIIRKAAHKSSTLPLPLKKNASNEEAATYAVSMLEFFARTGDPKAKDAFLEVYRSYSGIIGKPNETFLKSLADTIKKSRDLYPLLNAFVQKRTEDLKKQGKTQADAELEAKKIDINEFFNAVELVFNPYGNEARAIMAERLMLGLVKNSMMKKDAQDLVANLVLEAQSKHMHLINVVREKIKDGSIKNLSENDLKDIFNLRNHVGQAFFDELNTLKDQGVAAGSFVNGLQFAADQIAATALQIRDALKVNKLNNGDLLDNALRGYAAKFSEQVKSPEQDSQVTSRAIDPEFHLLRRMINFEALDPSINNFAGLVEYLKKNKDKINNLSNRLLNVHAKRYERFKLANKSWTINPETAISEDEPVKSLQEVRERAAFQNFLQNFSVIDLPAFDGAMKTLDTYGYASEASLSGVIQSLMLIQSRDAYLVTPYLTDIVPTLAHVVYQEKYFQQANAAFIAQFAATYPESNVPPFIRELTLYRFRRIKEELPKIMAEFGHPEILDEIWERTFGTLAWENPDYFRPRPPFVLRPDEFETPSLYGAGPFTLNLDPQPQVEAAPGPGGAVLRQPALDPKTVPNHLYLRSTLMPPMEEMFSPGRPGFTRIGGLDISRLNRKLAEIFADSPDINYLGRIISADIQGAFYAGTPGWEAALQGTQLTPTGGGREFLRAGQFPAGSGPYHVEQTAEAAAIPGMSRTYAPIPGVLEAGGAVHRGSERVYYEEDRIIEGLLDVYKRLYAGSKTNQLIFFNAISEKVEGQSDYDRLKTYVMWIKPNGDTYVMAYGRDDRIDFLNYTFASAETEKILAHVKTMGENQFTGKEPKGGWVGNAIGVTADDMAVAELTSLMGGQRPRFIRDGQGNFVRLETKGEDEPKDLLDVKGSGGVSFSRLFGQTTNAFVAIYRGGVTYRDVAFEANTAQGPQTIGSTFEEKSAQHIVEVLYRKLASPEEKSRAAYIIRGLGGTPKTVGAQARGEYLDWFPRWLQGAGITTGYTELNPVERYTYAAQEAAAIFQNFKSFMASAYAWNEKEAKDIGMAIAAAYMINKFDYYTRETEGTSEKTKQYYKFLFILWSAKNNLLVSYSKIPGYFNMQESLINSIEQIRRDPANQQQIIDQTVDTIISQSTTDIHRMAIGYGRDGNKVKIYLVGSAELIDGIEGFGNLRGLAFFPKGFFVDTAALIYTYAYGGSINSTRYDSRGLYLDTSLGVGFPGPTWASSEPLAFDLPLPAKKFAGFTPDQLMKYAQEHKVEFLRYIAFDGKLMYAEQNKDGWDIQVSNRLMESKKPINKAYCISFFDPKSEKHVLLLGTYEDYVEYASVGVRRAVDFAEKNGKLNAIVRGDGVDETVWLDRFKLTGTFTWELGTTLNSDDLTPEEQQRLSDANDKGILRGWAAQVLVRIMKSRMQEIIVGGVYGEKTLGTDQLKGWQAIISHSIEQASDDFTQRTVTYYLFVDHSSGEPKLVAGTLSDLLKFSSTSVTPAITWGTVDIRQEGTEIKAFIRIGKTRITAPGDPITIPEGAPGAGGQVTPFSEGSFWFGGGGAVLEFKKRTYSYGFGFESVFGPYPGALRDPFNVYGYGYAPPRPYTLDEIRGIPWYIFAYGFAKW